MQDKIFGVIMAGGGGTRFWPLSRNKTPKQLLNLSGKDFMVNETVERLKKITALKNIFIVTNTSQSEIMASVTSRLIDKNNILKEPCARNTSACIGYSAVKILKTCGDGIMVVSPSDAYIKDNDKYAEILNQGIEKAKTSDGIVTIGIAPTFPATGYGYINFDKSNEKVKKVVKFVEKPNFEKAKEYLDNGNYVWNSGVFIFKASVILNCFKEYLSDIYEKLLILYSAIDTPDEEKVLNEIYPSMRSVSIDYGVMEKAKEIYVVFGDFGWSDVGSWDMLSVLHTPDNDGNIVLGNDNVVIDCKDTTVYSKNKTVAVVGMRDVVVVQTDDAIMVCPKSKAQDVKKIVDHLKNSGRENLL